jgi:hypothetical protein
MASKESTSPTQLSQIRLFNIYELSFTPYSFHGCSSFEWRVIVRCLIIISMATTGTMILDIVSIAMHGRFHRYHNIPVGSVVSYVINFIRTR